MEMDNANKYTLPFPGTDVLREGPLDSRELAVKENQIKSKCESIFSTFY